MSKTYKSRFVTARAPLRARRSHAPKAALLAGACAAVLVTGAAPVVAAPIYAYSQTLAIPGVTTFSGYDLATFDTSTQLYYLTDRSNQGVDVYSAATNSFVERLTAPGLFSGAQSFGGTANNQVAGPNGIYIGNAPGGGKLLVAGNTIPSSITGTSPNLTGTGNVVAFDLAANGTTVNGSARTITAQFPATTTNAATPTPSNRVDGVAYDPVTNTILAANNTSNPGFITIINNATSTVTASLVLDGTNGKPNAAGNGVEAPIYDAARNSFFVAIPALSADASGNPADAGGVIEVDPVTGALKNVYSFTALGLTGACNPAGLAQGPGSSFFIACSDPTSQGSVILNLAGATPTIRVVAGIEGGDQAYYDPNNNTYFESARFEPGGPVLGIIDGTTFALQTLTIGNNDHSIAVDPISGEAFLATGPTTAFPGCTNGCIAVFTPVPEPSTLPVFAMALTVLGLTVRLRRS